MFNIICLHNINPLKKIGIQYNIKCMERNNFHGFMPLPIEERASTKWGFLHTALVDKFELLSK